MKNPKAIFVYVVGLDDMNNTEQTWMLVHCDDELINDDLLTEQIYEDTDLELNEFNEHKLFSDELKKQIIDVVNSGDD